MINSIKVYFWTAVVLVLVFLCGFLYLKSIEYNTYKMAYENPQVKIKEITKTKTIEKFKDGKIIERIITVDNSVNTVTEIKVPMTKKFFASVNYEPFSSRHLFGGGYIFFNYIGVGVMTDFSKSVFLTVSVVF